MSRNQLHGKEFERRVIVDCFGVPKELADEFSSTAIFDIPLGVTTCQHPTGQPVSIKTTAVKVAGRSAMACLSDARRVWAWNEPLILVVGLYAQEKQEKVFHTVYEFHLQLGEAERQFLYGQITPADVESFHDALKGFGAGQHQEARMWAKRQKRQLQPKGGAIQLNPKIDSKLQRRLQCSALVSALLDGCAETRAFTQESLGGYRGLQLPLRVNSSKREFSRPSRGGLVEPMAP